MTKFNDIFFKKRKIVTTTLIYHKNDDEKLSFFDKCRKFSRTIKRI